ncbi:MAG: ankyrin repeat protein [Fluviicola sp.]|jgi:ankyrin repeat protein|uniref:ankyrin repeat domain-containing protein n=1 Tax=Fluviicola sp. TaxID=1917219 RepID=UPI002628EC90|nr:ankyrin repeat domain-containing protein [Fluviicola sp.]MDF3028204.1 ankyrin repeat protein [Fluviicola sp.]
MNSQIKGIRLGVLTLLVCLPCLYSWAQSEETVSKFYEAIFSDNETLVIEMLESKEFPGNSEPAGKIAPLQAAIWQNNFNIAIALIEHGANINSSSYSSVLVAVEYGACEILAYLVEHEASFREIGSFRSAGFYQHYACARFLLEQGANQEIGDLSGKLWVLHEAVSRADYEVLDLLVLSPEEIDAMNCEGENALILAVKQRDVQLAQYLLKRGADKNTPETFDCGDDITFGLSPLNIAKKNKDAKMVEVLK